MLRIVKVLFVGILLTSVAASAAPKFKSVEKLVTTAGTRVALAATDTYSSCIILQARTANTGNIYVGDSTVAAANGYVIATGKELQLGCGSLIRGSASNEAINLKDVYIDAATNGEGVRILYVYGRYKSAEPIVQ